jgi:predicted 3-demethylubiquinone-9 3-methyltransferase (glyoxalase superfamily)
MNHANTPAILMQAITHPEPTVAKRTFEAMMQMVKIDIAKIESAMHG